jgi:hypothetical protein
VGKEEISMLVLWTSLNYCRERCWAAALQPRVPRWCGTGSAAAGAPVVLQPKAHSGKKKKKSATNEFAAKAKALCARYVFSIKAVSPFSHSTHARSRHSAPRQWAIFAEQTGQTTLLVTLVAALALSLSLSSAKVQPLFAFFGQTPSRCTWQTLYSCSANKNERARGRVNFNSITERWRLIYCRYIATPPSTAVLPHFSSQLFCAAQVFCLGIQTREMLVNIIAEYTALEIKMTLSTLLCSLSYCVRKRQFLVKTFIFTDVAPYLQLQRIFGVELYCLLLIFRYASYTYT